MAWARIEQTKTPLLQTSRGFTIVELLIVIVIIAILAVIAIVAYSNIRDRALFSREQSDLKTLTKALALYKVDHDAYPITDDLDGCTYDWCGWDQATGDSFIPGLVPQYISATPQMPSNLPIKDTYLYQSNGTDYQLIRYKIDGLSTIETQNNPLLALTNGYYDDRTDAYYAWGIERILTAGGKRILKSLYYLHAPYSYGTRTIRPYGQYLSLSN
jgi:prepilin-type N-terminal cleavage/methylation domain-containing protein